MHYQPKQDLLNDRIILVTGASDGIGREAAMTYARYGATVILLGRNEEKLRQVASHINEETGRQPQWFILDLLTCTSEDCQQLAQRITVNYPRLDGVLHNAGLLGDVCPMSEQNPQVWQDVMQVNVNATFLLTQALLPLLLKSDAGSLVFTSSSVLGHTSIYFFFHSLLTLLVAFITHWEIPGLRPGWASKVMPVLRRLSSPISQR